MHTIYSTIPYSMEERGLPPPQMNPEGYVHLSVIGRFNRVRALTQDQVAIKEAMVGSTVVEMAPGTTENTVKIFDPFYKIVFMGVFFLWRVLHMYFSDESTRIP